jgi:hypothetical protein
MKLSDFYPDSVKTEEKSTTTYEQYQDIARRLILHLNKLSKKKQKDYTENERELTPSLVKSVLIGLGESDPALSAQLVKAGEFAYIFKKKKV